MVGLFEYVFYPLLAIFDWYYFLKAAFFVWCMYPSDKINGSLIIYGRVIRPLYLKYHKKIDANFENVNEAFDAVAKQADAAKNLIGAAQTLQAAANGAK
jgi:hypothetical protein